MAPSALRTLVWLWIYHILKELVIFYKKAFQKGRDATSFYLSHSSKGEFKLFLASCNGAYKQFFFFCINVKYIIVLE